MDEIPSDGSGLGDPQEVRVLIVDDDALVLRTLTRILERAGFSDITAEVDSTRITPDHLGESFDAILLDLHMPQVDGFEIMHALVEHAGPEGYAPILVLTGDQRADVRERALASGAKDFVQKPFDPTEVVARLRNVVHTGRMHRRLQSFNEALAMRVEERTADVVAAKLELLDRLARAGEYRDDQTGTHAARVGVLSGMLAIEIGLDEERATMIGEAAPLHDIGKIGIPDAILLKAGPLTEEEFATIRNHAVIGSGILSGSRFDLLQTAERIALTHHEHWNGDGYPYGLAGEAIPMEGRIVSVADAFDSLTNERPYRTACSHRAAVEEILRWRGRQFAPDVVDALCRLHRQGVLSTVQAATEAAAVGTGAHVAGPGSVETDAEEDAARAG